MNPNLKPDVENFSPSWTRAHFRVADGRLFAAGEPVWVCRNPKWENHGFKVQNFFVFAPKKDSLVRGVFYTSASVKHWLDLSTEKSNEKQTETLNGLAKPYLEFLFDQWAQGKNPIAAAARVKAQPATQEIENAT